MEFQHRVTGSIFVTTVLLSFLVILVVGAVVFVVLDDGDQARFETEIVGPTSPILADTDGDGLTDGTELRDLPTAASVVDTDQDGISDGKEHSLQTSSIRDDTDRDSISDGRELRADLVPTRKDSDQDGVGDAKEFNSRVLNATNADTDGDGLTDGNELDLGSDPVKADSDGDTIPDGDEFQRGFSPVQTDSDGDQLNDAQELNISWVDGSDKDTDNDGLTDGYEYLDSPTNASIADMDRDGLLDGVEVKGTAYGLRAADPLSRDVFIEVDKMEGTEFHKSDFRDLKAAYASAPVKNPDGTTGVTVHVAFDESVQSRDDLTVSQYYNTTFKTEFERRGYGYRHIVVVDSVSSDSGKTISGVTRLHRDGAIVTHYSGNDMTGVVAMHELGHILGLAKSDYVGIDTKKRSTDVYPSVMNYNGMQEGNYMYSGSAGPNGDGFDDWAHLGDGFARPNMTHVLPNYASNRTAHLTS